MNRISVRILIVFTTLCMCSCSRSDQESTSHTFRVFTENGVTIAENEGAPKYPGDIFAYEKVLELRADPEVEGSMLLDPHHVTLDSDGNIYVVDEGDMSIVMFDSAGMFLRRFGREGYGPGEFRGIGLPHVSGGNLYALDRWQDRITRFRLGGELLDVLPLPSGQGPNLAMIMIEDVVLTEEDHRIITRRLIGRGRTTGMMGYDVLILDAHNDSLWSISTPMLENSYTTSYSTSISISLIPYGILPSIVFHPRFGIYVSDGENPVVYRYTIDGNRDLEIRFRLDRETVTAEERSAIHRSMDDDIAEAMDRNIEFARARREAVVIADQKPYWTNVVVDDGGFIWLLQSETFEETKEAGGSLFRVVSPGGEYLGDSRWPKSLHNASISHGCICFLMEEESGEMIPVVYRIRSIVDESLLFDLNNHLNLYRLAPWQ